MIDVKMLKTSGNVEYFEVSLLLDGPLHLLLQHLLVLVDLVQPLLHPPRPLPVDNVTKYSMSNFGIHFEWEISREIVM